jgi:uncharacterized protein (UPF0332 family)
MRVADLSNEQRRVLAAQWWKSSEDALQAAAMLLGAANWRGSLNRAYYAVYSAGTARLCTKRNVVFPPNADGTDRYGPAHLLMNQLPGISKETRKRITQGVRDLYDLRVLADYVPKAQFSLEDARSAYNKAKSLVRLLES